MVLSGPAAQQLRAQQDVLPVRLRVYIDSDRYRRMLHKDTLALKALADTALRRVMEERLPVANWSASQPAHTVALRLQQDQLGNLFMSVYVENLAAPDTAKSAFETSDQISKRLDHPEKDLQPKVIVQDWARYLADIVTNQTQNFVKVLGDLPLGLAIQFDPQQLVYVLPVGPQQIHARLQPPTKFRIVGILLNPADSVYLPAEVITRCGVKAGGAYGCKVNTVKYESDEPVTNLSDELRRVLSRNEWKDRKLYLYEYWVELSSGLAAPGKP